MACSSLSRCQAITSMDRPVATLAVSSAIPLSEVDQTREIRRIVTGVDDSGKSVWVSERAGRFEPCRVSCRSYAGDISGWRNDN